MSVDDGVSEVPASDPTSTMSQEKKYDCMDCGACCGCFPIFATEDDVVLEPQIKEKGIRVENCLRTHRVAYRMHPLPFLDACAFLKEDKLCRIYETRPEVCRKFESGSEQCIEARHRLGIG
jgi:Fe-S-cluster containining protein